MLYHRPLMPLPRSPGQLLSYSQGSFSEYRRSVCNCDDDAPPLPPRNYRVAAKTQREDNECFGVNGRSSIPPPLPPRPKIINTNDEIGLERLDMSTGIFTPISSDAPSTKFKKVRHDVALPVNTNNNNKPVQTNKFYGNMLLGSQTSPVWTHPYSLWIDKSSKPGMAVAYIKSSQRVFDTANKPPRYLFSPTGIKSFVFSSTEFKSADDMSVSLNTLKHLSAQVRLQKSDQEYIRFYLVQGMGFVTAIYYNLIPKVYSGVGFKSISGDTSPRSGISKYKIVLKDNAVWTLYVTIPGGQSLQLALQNNAIVGDRSINGGLFQIVPDTNSDIDRAAGCYPITADLTGSVSGSKGNYTLTFTNAGESNSGTSLMYALPHQVENFTSRTVGKINSKLDSTVYGSMTGYLTKAFDMTVEVPSGLGFDPYTTIKGKGGPKYSDDVLSKIREAAASEIDGDVVSESNVDSMYTAGKILAKYAWILYCCQYVIKDSDKVSKLLPKLKEAISRFTGNQQILPLKYDSVWGGIISSGTVYQDYGNAYYNDHHFHYGYHVIAAAIVALVDKDASDGKWLGGNRVWVENLIRDYSNPSSTDIYFPMFRSFDWFTGHSWAKGLFESADGKDEESSSEDVNSAYALKLWGLAVDNKQLAAIGDLSLGVLKTSLNHYFLFTDDNKTQPASFIPNKVSGILFENKLDHATYFGTETQFIHMIHAIPITPASSFIRSPTFVREEWEQILSKIVDKVDDGWKGIMMLNLALYDPKTAYEFFSGSGFQDKYLDNGQSKTWSLTYSGAFK
ncbi:endo-1,3(4)-beta-glucanase Ecym_4220 [Eremothecium cymbalariae DBVPG|uniref:glucan endo-1,3-beta-D-glucosidase n=1 Tax=Eremothecium cymbalariae (strain CBS 270.75 / DBVPG 7215 / KCTC 17166 / NRRL Y-17582) TaxID=931890 RepID=G8JTD4_ERECY|nr:hypothetical protein Ecym_4220 [Eremothecium cymbalariae DBVPG\